MTLWPDFTVDLVRTLGGGGHSFALLQILVVLPEEVNSRNLRLGNNRRDQVIEVREQRSYWLHYARID